MNYTEKITSDAFNLWREEGRYLIHQHFDVFHNLVEQAREFVQNGKYDVAAVYSEMAASYATRNHCGLFVSLELEQILLTIGQQIKQTNIFPRGNTSSHKRPRNILHVCTTVMPIGGHSRMLWRWIQQDTDRSHSLVLTRQAPNKVPKILRDAVEKSHGKIYILNKRVGSILSWARRLREIAASADLVVLHIFNYDVIPIIAFANKEQMPPVLFLNHADHLFWLGASISDVVVNLRESGMYLSQKRRNIEPQRSTLLPIILNPIHRQLSRTEAKQQLGLAEDTILLLSIARSCKYRTIDGVNFAAAHVSLLKQHDRAMLIVIGSNNYEEWLSAIQETQGRIKVFGEREDTAIFYQAADIYVDSFPFVSNTSLLEAGSYGVPLVSRYPYSDACGILGADMPGLTGNLIRVRSLEEYTAVLSRLVSDEEFRLSLGETTRRRIAEVHMGDSWQHLLEEIYAKAISLPSVKVELASTDKIFLDEPDVFLPCIYGEQFNLELFIQYHLPIMPLAQRWHHWVKLVTKYGFRHRISLLLPEWLNWRYLCLKNVLAKFVN